MGSDRSHHLGWRNSHWISRSDQLNRQRTNDKGSQKASGDGDGMTA